MTFHSISCYTFFFLLHIILLYAVDFIYIMYCQHSHFRLVQLYIHRRDCRFVPLLLMYIYYNKFKKHNNPCKSWVKISKVMPQSQVRSPGKGREALRQKSKKFFVLNMVRLNRTPYSHLKIYGLTVHIIQNFSIFQKHPIKS